MTAQRGVLERLGAILIRLVNVASSGQSVTLCTEDEDSRTRTVFCDAQMERVPMIGGRHRISSGKSGSWLVVSWITGGGVSGWEEISLP